MVDISEKVVLSYKGVNKAVVPDNLVSVGPDGRKFLKIQGSHPLVCRLVAADNLEALKTCKNPSLCQGDAFDSLRKKQEEALHKALSEAKEEEEKEKDLFKVEKHPKKKLKLSSGPDFLTLNLDGNDIEVLKPRTWKDKDVSVLLGSSMLAVTFDFLATDVDTCFKDGNKRSYRKKGGKNDEDELHNK